MLYLPLPFYDHFISIYMLYGVTTAMLALIYSTQRSDIFVNENETKNDNYLRTKDRMRIKNFWRMEK